MEGSPLLCLLDGISVSISSHYDLPWVPKGRCEKLLIKWGAVKNPQEARLKGPDKFIKSRRPPTWDEIKGVQAPPTHWPCQTHQYKNPQALSGLRLIGSQGRSLAHLPLRGEVVELFFSTSPKTLVSGIWFDTDVQRSWASSNRSRLLNRVC